jgi:SagB-type dehydrogenase family enzyme
MKNLLIAAVLAAASMGMAETIKLPPPDKDSGVSVVQALKARHSERAFSEKEIPAETLSGLLWAANGFNRPDKRTNATALNLQTITVYAIMKSGAYRYDAKANALVKVCDKDLRPAIAAQQAYAAVAPVSLLVTADVSGPVYKGGTRSTLTHYDAGIVSGNIYLYCAANGLATVCRRSMDNEALKKALNLPASTILHLNHPVGHPAAK